MLLVLTTMALAATPLSECRSLECLALAPVTETSPEYLAWAQAHPLGADFQPELAGDAALRFLNGGRTRVAYATPGPWTLPWGLRWDMDKATVQARLGRSSDLQPHRYEAGRASLLLDWEPGAAGKLLRASLYVEAPDQPPGALGPPVPHACREGDCVNGFRWEQYTDGRQYVGCMGESGVTQPCLRGDLGVFIDPNLTIDLRAYGSAEKPTEPTCLHGDCVSGHGWQVYQYGRRLYTGPFVAGKPSGTGLSWGEGEAFAATFVDGQPVEGSLRLANGVRVVGRFVDGVPSPDAQVQGQPGVATWAQYQAERKRLEAERLAVAMAQATAQAAARDEAAAQVEHDRWADHDRRLSAALADDIDVQRRVTRFLGEAAARPQVDAATLGELEALVGRRLDTLDQLVTEHLSLRVSVAASPKVRHLVPQIDAVVASLKTARGYTFQAQGLLPAVREAQRLDAHKPFAWSLDQAPTIWRSFWGKLGMCEQAMEDAMKRLVQLGEALRAELR